MVFVTFTNYLHDVHILFIINCYTELTLREANKINFFIIAQMPKGVWALLILRFFSRKEKEQISKSALYSFISFHYFSCSLLMVRISSFSDSILASRSDTIFAHSISSLLICSGASPSNL